MKGNKLHNYLPAIVEHSEKQWSLMIGETQAKSSVKRKSVNKSAYKKGYESLTWNETKICEDLIFSLSSLANMVGRTLSNKEIVVSMRGHDTEGILNRWTDKTFANKLTAIQKRASWCPGTENSLTETMICGVFSSWCSHAKSIGDTRSAYQFLHWTFLQPEEPARKKTKLDNSMIPALECASDSNSNNKQTY